ncbi:hypothetical protein [Streptomyces sp. VNUA24]|uniref:hypothetical protein n=1 Tax=Streptomyces sp. VNUA24 TaxID=3031131 RepID=UPI0023B7CE64|nr:hypothetical protein [Streptomyces sp. VNUA24]WEH13234.1 hypothetical protein PYR72_05800 [Streptomyces sp. VNUA24]
MGTAFAVAGLAATQSGGEGYRMATARGHAAVYLSGHKTGNIAKGTPITVTVCAVKGAKAQCGSAHGRA